MEFVFKTLYSMIYYYSCLEIWVNAKLNENVFYKQLCDYIDSFYVSSTQYLFVVDGDQTTDVLTLPPKKYDFILRNEYVKKRKNYKILYENIKDIKDNFEVSKASFLSFIVKYKEFDIDIQLDTREYTFMIVGNCINKKFIYYLLKNMGFAKESFSEFDYSVQILTSDVKLLNLSSSDKLLITKNKFTIFNI